MLFEFDPAKDKLNRASHGLSLAFAKQLAWDEGSSGSTSASGTKSFACRPWFRAAIVCTSLPSQTEGTFVVSSAFAMPSEGRSSTMSRTTSKRSLLLPSQQENKKIAAAAKADPDARPLTKRQLEAMVPLKSLRGRPPLENKKLLVSVRYSPEVLAYFRSTGQGWQARMDGVLKQYVSKQPSRRARKAT